MNSKVSAILVVLFVLFAALPGGVWYLNGRLVELQGQYDDLEQRRTDAEATTNALQNQVLVFKKAFTDLEQYHISTASNDVAFLDEVQSEIRANSVNVESMRKGPVSPDGRSSLVLKLRGDYYSFTRVLASWRNLPTTVRVASLNITGSQTPETQGEVVVDVTVEAIVSSIR